jgi:hypothetical protein
MHQGECERGLHWTVDIHAAAQLGDYWNEKARKMSAALALVSDKQRQKIESAF